MKEELLQVIKTFFGASFRNEELISETIEEHLSTRLPGESLIELADELIDYFEFPRRGYRGELRQLISNTLKDFEQRGRE